MWIIMVWQISHQQCFQKCCISAAVDEVDVDMLWNGNEEGGNVRDLCQEDEGTDCEGGDSDTDW
jgi:hypothetical protein